MELFGISQKAIKVENNRGDHFYSDSRLFYLIFGDNASA